MNLKRSVLFVILLLSIIFISGCPGGEKKKGSDENQQAKTMPQEITKMESGLLEIMRQADLAPYIEKVSQQEQEVKKQDDVTFEQTILGEVLKREAKNESSGSEEQPLPKDTAEIWDTIKMKVAELHDQYDQLEPTLMRENIYQSVIDSFEEDLDKLTVYSTEQNHMGTLTAANRLTESISKFMAPFAENPTRLACELKFHTRNILIQVAANSFEAAQSSLDYMKEQSAVLSSALSEIDAKDKAEEYDTSLENLQRAVDKRNIDLIKINAAVVMENLVQITKKLEQQSSG